MLRENAQNCLEALQMYKDSKTIKSKPLAKSKSSAGKVTTIARERSKEEILEDIMIWIADGKSLATICKEKGYPNRKTFFEWVAKDNSIAAQYQTALAMRAELFAEQLISISDNDSFDFNDEGKLNPENIARSKLKVDTRKWIVSRLLPKKYGDKLDLTHGSNPENPLTVLIQQVSGSSFTPVEDES